MPGNKTFQISPPPKFVSKLTEIVSFKTLWNNPLLLHLLQSWCVVITDHGLLISNEYQTQIFYAQKYVLLLWRLAGEWVWGVELGGEHMWPGAHPGGFYMYCARSLTILYGRIFSYLCLCIRGRWGSWGSNHGPCLTVSNKKCNMSLPKQR